MAAEANTKERHEWGFWKKLNRRKWYRYPFLQPGLQTRIGVLTVSIGLFNSLVILFLFYMYSWLAFSDFAQWLPDQVVVDDYMAEVSHLWLKVSIFFITVESVAVYLFSLLFSHRIAGPLYATSLRLRQLRDGIVPEAIIIRREDSFMRDFVNDMNQTLESLRSVELKRREALNRAIDEIRDEHKEAAILRLEAIKEEGLKS